MSKTFELNLPGLNELMKSAEMCAILNNAAAQYAASAGIDDFEIEAAHPISFVAIASVRTKTEKGHNSAMDDNALEKARGGVKV